MSLTSSFFGGSFGGWLLVTPISSVHFYEKVICYTFTPQLYQTFFCQNTLSPLLRLWTQFQFIFLEYLYPWMKLKIFYERFI